MNINPEIDKYFKNLVDNHKLIVKEDGTVYNPRTGRMLGKKRENRYVTISYFDVETGKTCCIQCHRLVWIAFNGLIDISLMINHKDGDKSNNNLSNLELVTASGNVRHALEHGLIKPIQGEDKPNAKFTNEEVRKYRLMYDRGELSICELAKLQNVSIPTASDMLHRRTYVKIK